MSIQFADASISLPFFETKSSLLFQFLFPLAVEHRYIPEIIDLIFKIVSICVGLCVMQLLTWPFDQLVLLSLDMQLV